MSIQARTEFPQGVITAYDADGSVANEISVSVPAMEDDGVATNATPYVQASFHYETNGAATQTLTVDGITVDAVTSGSSKKWRINLEMWLDKNSGFMNLTLDWQEYSTLATIVHVRELVELTAPQTAQLVGGGFIIKIAATSINAATPKIGYAKVS
jgi:hypothetical protein